MTAPLGGLVFSACKLRHRVSSLPLILRTNRPIFRAALHDQIRKLQAKLAAFNTVQNRMALRKENCFIHRSKKSRIPASSSTITTSQTRIMEVRNDNQPKVIRARIIVWVIVLARKTTISKRLFGVCLTNAHSIASVHSTARVINVLNPTGASNVSQITKKAGRTITKGAIHAGIPQHVHFLSRSIEALERINPKNSGNRKSS